MFKFLSFLKSKWKLLLVVFALFALGVSCISLKIRNNNLLNESSSDSGSGLQKHYYYGTSSVPLYE